jgi:hypothetical protein
VLRRRALGTIRRDGKCLDDPGFSTANGTQLIIHTCTGRRNQQWKLP